ncbi:hypothetical protein RQP46_005498 [Phenoliferia psychrophenolica]
MGQGESSQADPKSSSSGVAFHVLRVAEQSPAAEAGIDPFFDFICGVNGHPLGDEIDELTTVLEESEGSPIVLQVYSTKRKELRDVDVIPSRHWSSNGATGAHGQPSLLGLSLRLCHPQAALEQVWHVLEILEGSPAQSAGLVPFGDWIVGYAGGVLRGEGDFYDVVESHVDKPLRLFVYNADYDVTREAILVPNRSWGGEGLLGCGVGYGLLHRIPRPQDRVLPPQTNDDDSEEEDDSSDAAIIAHHSARSPPKPVVTGTVHRPISAEEASYGRFAESEGVQVVAVGEEEDYGSFIVPADGYGLNQQQPMAIPAGTSNGRTSWGAPMPRRVSTVPAGEELLEEDEEAE